MSGISNRNSAFLALLVAMLLWGITLVLSKAALDSMGLFGILTLRFGLAFVCLAPFAWRRGYRLRLSVDRRYIIFGLTGMVLHLGLETAGLLYTSATNAALIVAAIPALTAAGSAVFLGERVTRMRSAGIIASVVGVIIIVAAQGAHAGRLHVIGDVLVLGGVLAWVVYTIQGKRLVERTSAIVATAAATGAAFVLTAPLALLELGFVGGQAPTIGALGAVVYLGVGASAMAYGLWNYALNHVDASVAAPFVNLVPVIGVIAAAMAGETISPVQLTGGAVVGIGVWLSSRSWGWHSGVDERPAIALPVVQREEARTAS